MSLLEIRQKFVESSGRYDLVMDEANWADAGADWFIKAGQRYLDRMLETGDARARFFSKLAASAHTVKIPSCRVIEAVWRHDGEEKLILSEERFYGEVGLTAGAPTKYAPVSVRLAPGSDLNAIIGDYANIVFNSPVSNGLFFGGKSDKEYGIEVSGLFYSSELSADTSVSFWTEQNPEILVAAAFMSMERFYRNFEGSKESRAQVEDMVRQLDFDYVAQEIVNITKLEG